MRHWINLIEHAVGETILITDLYSNDELTDESEALADAAPPMYWNRPLTVREMSAEDARHVTKDYDGDMTVVDTFLTATKRAQQLVARKARSYDHDRIIVLCGHTIIDGNHHLMAAIQTGNPVRYVDLDDWDR